VHTPRAPSEADGFVSACIECTALKERLSCCMEFLIIDIAATIALLLGHFAMVVWNRMSRAA